jgi:hypothetical protein
MITFDNIKYYTKFDIKLIFILAYYQFLNLKLHVIGYSNK